MPLFGYSQVKTVDSDFRTIGVERIVEENGKVVLYTISPSNERSELIEYQPYSFLTPFRFTLKLNSGRFVSFKFDSVAQKEFFESADDLADLQNHKGTYRSTGALDGYSYSKENPKLDEETFLCGAFLSISNMDSLTLPIIIDKPQTDEVIVCSGTALSVIAACENIAARACGGHGVVTNLGQRVKCTSMNSCKARMKYLCNQSSQ